MRHGWLDVGLGAGRDAILTICSRITDVRDYDGVTLFLPHLIGGEGVLAAIPLALDRVEHEWLRRSAGVLREAITSMASPDGVEANG